MTIANPTSDPECPEARGANFGVYGSHLLDLPRLLPPTDFKSVDHRCGEVTAADVHGPTHDFVRTYERSRSTWKRLCRLAASSEASFESSNDKKRVRFDRRDGRDTGAISEAA